MKSFTHRKLVTTALAAVVAAVFSLSSQNVSADEAATLKAGEFTFKAPGPWKAKAKPRAMSKGGLTFAQSGEGLTEIFRLIDELERTEIETIVYTNYSSLAHWWILAGLILLLLETALSASALRVLP